MTLRSGLEEAARVRSGAIGAEELLDEYLGRIDARDPELHAFVTRLDERARRRARWIDHHRSEWPEPLPAFWGVPTAIKDTDPLRFAFTRVGSRAFRWAWTPFDSGAVKALRAGGFVFVGKTTTSELALMPVVEPDIHPPTCNPWDPTRTAGGSSGGAAAAVASGMLPVAHAADGGGSIRIPAALCGVFGHKPSRSLTAKFYRKTDPLGLSVTGPIAHTVADAAGMLDVLCNRPQAGPSFLAALDELRPKALRIRVCTASPLCDVDPEIAAGVRRVAAELEAMGHGVDEAGPLDGTLEEFVPVFGWLAARIPALSERLLQPVTRWLRQAGRTLTEAQAREGQAALSARVDAWFGDADLCLLPSVGVPAPPVGAWTHLEPRAQFEAAAALGAFTAAFNLTGQPAASVPVGVTMAGLPYGAQLAGRRDADALVLRVARALEEALDWRASLGGTP